MCLICIELVKQRMSIKEAKRAVREVYQFGDKEDKHLQSLAKALEDLDIELLGKVLEES